MDLGRGEPFILTVVPPHEIAIDFRHVPEPGQFTGPSRSPQRAREHFSEIQSGQPVPQRAGILLTVLVQWEVGKPRMLSRKAPRGFAVPGEIDGWKSVAHGYLTVFTEAHRVGPCNWSP